jgi:dienelactone hydrolase
MNRTGEVDRLGVFTHLTGQTTLARSISAWYLELWSRGPLGVVQGPTSGLPEPIKGIRVIRRAPLLGILGILLAVPAAQADVPAGLSASCTVKTAEFGYSFRFCDDGLPPVGQVGLTPNEGAVNAVPVPAKYDGHTGLPDKAGDASSAPGADSNGDNALDVDVSLPTSAAPAGGYPVIVMMHGCCGGTKNNWERNTLDASGEAWHYNNAWFAARGYAVVTYTARGFYDGSGANKNGSTGQTQLDSRLFEINDFQSLVGQLVDDPFYQLNPEKVIATGGSYGGGFAYMAMTDPKWKSPDGADISLAAAAPLYGWTDLLYSLVPNGHQLSDPGSMPSTDPLNPDSLDPIGLGKKSTIDTLFRTGSGVFGSGTTFTPALVGDQGCIDLGDPIATSPYCAGSIAHFGEYVVDRSAYYQNDFFTNIAGDPSYRVPLFMYVPWTDPLFSPIEGIRFYNRLKSVVPGYPVQMVFGASTPHFAQNKAKEWGDVCNGYLERRVCSLPDYAGFDEDTTPASLQRMGINTRLNDFIDHYGVPANNPAQPAPAFDVTGAVEVCPDTATTSLPEDEAGDQFNAATVAGLAPNKLTINYSGRAATRNRVTKNPHAFNADGPNRLGKCVDNTITNTSGKRKVTPAGGGVAIFTSSAVTTQTTLLGLPKLTLDYLASNSTNLQLNVRVYDVLPKNSTRANGTAIPNGTALMVDRGPYKAVGNSGTASYETYGNGWVFKPGHKIRVEITQDDNGFITPSSIHSSAKLSNVKLELPIREASATISGKSGK